MSKESGYPSFEKGPSRRVSEIDLLGAESATEPNKPFKVATDDVDPFERPGFTGHVQIPLERGLGFSALTIWVDGEHPKKRMLEGTRTYYVADATPTGTFTIGDEVHGVEEGDLFVIPQGAEYSYQGEMTLFEVNVPSEHGKVTDEVIE